MTDLNLTDKLALDLDNERQANEALREQVRVLTEAARAHGLKDARNPYTDIPTNLRIVCKCGAQFVGAQPGIGGTPGIIAAFVEHLQRGVLDDPADDDDEPTEEEQASYYARFGVLDDPMRALESRSELDGNGDVWVSDDHPRPPTRLEREREFFGRGGSV